MADKAAPDPSIEPTRCVGSPSGLEDEFLERAQDVDVGGVRLPVIDREDLIIAKILAGRPIHGLSTR